jgi:inorganic triphosphatase YgiF
MSKEIELKLEVVGDQTALIASDLLFRGLDSQKSQQTSIYFDTRKKLLAKHGFSLRVRNTGDAFVQTLKRTVASDGLFSRDEWEWKVPAAELDRSKLRKVPVELPSESGKVPRKLHPVLLSEVERTTWQLRQGGSDVQVDLDVGTLSAGERHLNFAEIEFELLAGSAADVVTAARALAGRIPAKLGVLSKAERGAAMAEGTSEGVSKAAPISIKPTDTVGQAFASIMHACLKHYRLNEDVVVRGRAGDALHQSRVALRRLRSAFSFFRPVIADEQFHRLREELRWFTGQLGEARNLDVYLQRELAEEEKQATLQRREQAYDHVITSMNSAKLRLLLIDLMGWASVGSWRDEKLAGRPIRGFAKKRLNKLWATIEPARAMLPQMDEDSRHSLRIQVKKMRYAVEFFKEVYPRSKRKKRFFRAVEELQESLGKLNDLATARALTPDVATEIPHDDTEKLDHLGASETSLEDLCAAGPFWSSSKA